MGTTRRERGGRHEADCGALALPALLRRCDAIQRAITEYAQLSQATVKSTEIIAENLAQWRQPAESSKANHASAAVPQTQGERSETLVDGQPHS